MKKIIMVLFIAGFSLCHAQDEKQAPSKMSDFVSKTGVLLKFEDFDLPNINLNYGAAEAKIRRINSGGEIRYFYQISKDGKYDKKTASIAEEDLVEMEKALQTLKSQSLADSNSNANYMENKFVTDDGFQIGYFVSKQKVTWYMVLEKYGSDNTIFIKEITTIEEAFKAAGNRLTELKS